MAYFVESNKEIITKNIQDIIIINTNKYQTSHSTYLLTKEFIESLPESFYYSLFQKKIDKRYEIRVFFLRGKCHSLANFSQYNKMAAIDGRYLINEQGKLNRLVCFKLPHEIDNKIQQFMSICELESGSLDLIVSTDLEYYFLEVNPVGQFDYVSSVCNYYLEKKIANFLAYERAFI